jgi:2'-5' RNA ligase
MRYIIGLLATSPSFFIQEAQRQFSPTAIEYLLSETSLPHITLAQFKCDTLEILASLWRDVQSSISNIPQPNFLGIGLSKKHNNLWGVSLTVARDAQLIACQRTIVSILKQYDLICISPSDEQYRPHLTLARIPHPELMNFNDALLNPTPFILALGFGDENGQYIKTLHS